MQDLPIEVSASVLNARIEAEIATAIEGEFNLNRGFARLAGLLIRLKASEGWRELGHSSFNSYLLSKQEKFGRSSKQLYVYIGAAEHLLPFVGESGLDEMGIEKARALASASKKAKRQVTPELINAALDSAKGVNEIKALAHQIFELPDNELPKGNWFDWGGSYLTVEERKIFTDACQVAVRVLALPKDMPDWLKRKKILLAFAAEFDGTYRAEVFGARLGPTQQHDRDGNKNLPVEEGGRICPTCGSNLPCCRNGTRNSG